MLQQNIFLIIMKTDLKQERIDTLITELSYLINIRKSELKNIIIEMTEYTWTIHVGKIRIGWLKWPCSGIERNPVYFRIGRLDFYKF